MREGGQRTQPLGIRLRLLEPIADLLDHLIKRVQSQMWQRLCAQFLAIDVPLGSVLGCHTAVPIRSSEAACREHGRALAQESRARWRAQGKAPRLLAGSLVWPEPEVHAPLAGPGGLWHNTSADIVHDASCGQILPSPRGATGRAMSNPTRHTPQGPSSQRPTRAAPPAEAQADGATERSRAANVCSVRRSRGRPQPFWARTSRAPAPGDACVQARQARRARCSPAAA